MSVHAKKGDWVQIHEIVLAPEDRTAKIPEETQKVPVELWVKGFLQADGKIGDVVGITTITGRFTSGELVEINSVYTYSFGDEYVPELLKVGIQLKAILQEGEN